MQNSWQAQPVLVHPDHNQTHRYKQLDQAAVGQYAGIMIPSVQSDAVSRRIAAGGDRHPWSQKIVAG
jgi:hypothetical protein